MLIRESEELKKYINNPQILRDYQAEAVRNIIRILNSEGHNRFASVVLPTGSGKSFVAMALLQMINNPDFVAAGFDVSKPRNTSNMIYVAPTKDILFQLKLHIIKYIFLPNIDNTQKAEWRNLTKQQILESPELINDIVSSLFPNLQFKCYAGIKGLIDTTDVDVLTEKDVENADLIVFDEAHRTGANDWSKKIEKVLGQNAAKILAISATPERNDKEGKEMMAGIARMTYPGEIVTPNEYMAQEVYVLDAMRDGITNSPKVIRDPFYLISSMEYQAVLDQWRKAKFKNRKKELGDILDEMEAIIGISSKEFENRAIPEAVIMQKLIEITNRSITAELNSNISHGKMQPNDKAMVFIPNRENSEEDITVYVEKYINLLRQFYKGVIAPKTGKQIEIIPHILSSEFSDKINEKNLREFETATQDSPAVHMLFVQDKGKEGLHIDSAKIVYDLRGGDYANVSLQRAGRIIYSLDPEIPLYMQGKTRFFDINNSLFRQAVNCVGQKNSIQYDIYRLKAISKWITDNGRYPDANAGADIIDDNIDLKNQALAEREARMAYAIKRYQLIARQYQLGLNIELGQESAVKEFLELINQMPQNRNTDFLNVEIGVRTKEPSEVDLIGTEFLNTSLNEDKFLQLYTYATRLNKGFDHSKGRIDKLMHILNVISTFNPKLSLPRGILTKELVYESWNKRGVSREIESDIGNLSLDLREFLQNNFDKEQIKEMMVLLKAGDTKQASYYGEAYDFGRELAFARGVFFTAEKNTPATKKSPFEGYEMNEIINSGLTDFERCPELLLDIQNMFGLSRPEFLDYAGTISMAFKHEIDIPKQEKKITNLYNGIDSKKRKPPYSGLKFGVLDKYAGISLVTGIEVQTKADKGRQKQERKNETTKAQQQKEERKRVATLEADFIKMQKNAEARRKNARKTRQRQNLIEHRAIANNPEQYFTEKGFRHILTYGSGKALKPLYDFYEICDEQGFVYEENEKTGELEYHLLKDIEITRYIMTEMIDFGKSFDTVCQEYMKHAKCEHEVAESDIGFYLACTMDYYEKIPSILDAQYNDMEKPIFSGVDELLYSKGSSEKKKHIKEFLDIVARLTGKNFIDVRRKVLEQDQERVETLARFWGLNDTQRGILIDSQERINNSSYLDDYSR